jgi:glycosyltransferase involved in cell wall biosynthesis
MLDLSVIIPTRNKSNTIVPLLDNLRNQSISSNVTCEIIIIDNNSTDSTFEILKAYQLIWNQNTILRVAKESTVGVTYAREKGISISNGNYFLFLDDDVTFTENFLSKVIKFTKSHPDIKFICPKITPFHPTELYSDEQFYLDNWSEAFDIFDKGNQAKYLSLTIQGVPSTTALVIKRHCYFRTADMRAPDLFSVGLLELESVIKSFKKFNLWYEPSLEVKHNISREKLNAFYVKKRLFKLGLAKHFKRKNIRGVPYLIFLPVFWLNDLRRFLLNQNSLEKNFWRGVLFSPFYITRKILTNKVISWLSR